MKNWNQYRLKSRIPIYPFLPTVPSYPNSLNRLSSQVQAILQGSKGFVIDPYAVGTLFQDNPGTIPVSAVGQRIQSVFTRWGTTTRQFTTTNPNRPSMASGGRIQFDNATTQRLLLSNDDATANVPGATVVCRCELSSLAAQSSPWHFGTALGSPQQRLTMQSLITTGDMQSTVRRVDADAATSLSFAGGFVAGVPLVISQDVNYATTGVMRQYKNGSLVSSTTLAVTTGNSENSLSNIVTIGARAVTDYFPGFIGRFFYAPFVLTDPQRAIVEAWVAA